MAYLRRVMVMLMAALILCGCATRAPQDQYAVDADSPRPVRPAAGPALSGPPYLRTVVPADALAYARIPSLWAMLGEPKGNIYDQALRSAPYRAAVDAIHDGFRDHIAPEFKEGSEVLWRLFLTHSTSPAEFLILPGSGDSLNILFSMQLDLGRSALNDALGEMAVSMPVLSLAQSVDEHGDGVVSIGPQRLLLHYDAAASRLFALAGGQGADLNVLLSELVPVSGHVMYPLESSLDTTGQGFFFWVSGKGIKHGLIRLSHDDQSTPSPIGLLVQALDASRGIALGWGARNKRQRIRLVLDMPQSGFRRFTPLGAQAISLRAAGLPQAVFVLSLPDQNDLKLFEAGLASSLAPDDYRHYQDFKDKIKAKLGYSVEDVMAAVGKEWIYLSDPAGWYGAIPIRDPKRFDNLLASLEKAAVAVDHRVINGHRFGHLALPFHLKGGMETAASTPFQARWQGLPTHIYWVQEDNYLLVASTPEPLIDRYYQKTRVPIDAWLRNQQQQDLTGALFLATVRSDDVPRLVYNVNLELLQTLGDLVQQPVDLFALPTPQELALPASGAYSFRVDSTADQLALELSFDSTPAEGLLMGNGVAVMAMLGAIAIPSYQEYVVRSQVGQAISGTAPITQGLNQFHAEHGRFPRADEVKQLGIAQLPPYVSKIFIAPESGEITLELALLPLAANNRLLMTPIVGDQGAQWICKGNLLQKYLPPECQ